MSQKQFHFITAKGRPSGGGILATMASALVLLGALVLGGILLFFGAVFAIGLVIALLIWRAFFFKKTKRKAEEFLRQKAAEGNYGPNHPFNQFTKAGRGETIEGEFEDLSNHK